ncbi:MAG: winged helix-turn-helix transcriptional regulator [Bacteroidetes bacterium]|nr:winged helix-turn-helix transcriptional regulator [Bacteroidota bacterium]
MKINQKISIEQPVGRILSYAGKAFLTLLNARLDKLDIERNFYALLLIETGEGKITQQYLADLLKTDKTSVVRIVDYLSDNGYVKRIKSPVDRRKYSLTLTPKSKREIPIIRNAIYEITEMAFKSLKKSQVKEFYNTLKIINNNLTWQNQMEESSFVNR